MIRELRCKGCGKKLGEADTSNGTIIIVCPRCKRRNTFKNEPDK